jgi:hypothetical protein
MYYELAYKANQPVGGGIVWIRGLTEETEHGRPVAVLSLSWPSSKYPNSKIDQIAKMALKEAREISKALMRETSETNDVELSEILGRS